MRQQAQQSLDQQVALACQAEEYRCGVLRLVWRLSKQGFHYNRKTVAGSLKRQGLRAKNNRHVPFHVTIKIKSHSSLWNEMCVFCTFSALPSQFCDPCIYFYEITDSICFVMRNLLMEKTNAFSNN